MRQFLTFIYFWITLYMFPASKQVAVCVSHMSVFVCTVLNFWWWTERPSETCTVLFQNK